MAPNGRLVGKPYPGGHFPLARDPPEAGSRLLGSAITWSGRHEIGPCPPQHGRRPSVPQGPFRRGQFRPCP